jgi:pimeloyl-ACP methyl ester carboxylesterase
MAAPHPKVLVHGGGFPARCWEPMLPFLDGRVVNIDLPGRGARPAELTSVTVADFVDAVVEDIEAADLHDAVLVGHSLAGITIPQVAARIPERIGRLVFVSCTVPRDGQTTFETLDPEDQTISKRVGPGTVLPPLDLELTRVFFCNDMDEERTRFTMSVAVPEARNLIHEPMQLAGMPPEIPRTWVRLTRDTIVAPWKQDRFVENLGGAEVIELDSGHMAMISHPAELAAIVNAR